MKQRYRKFPYPVLFQDSHDYKLGEFKFKVDVIDNNEGYKIIIETLLSEDTIQAKIDSGEFIYIYSIESPYTKYRFSKLSSKNIFEFPIMAEKLVGELQINVAIIAFKDVVEYKNPNLNSIYKNYNVNFKKGDYIALDYTKLLEIENDIFGDVNRNSIINVIPNEEIESMYTSTDGEIIEVHLSKELAEIYNAYAKGGNYKEIIFNAIMVPALAEALNDLTTIEDVEYEDRKWITTIITKLAQLNIEVSDINKDDKHRTTTIAEMIYENPVKRLLMQIKGQEEDSYE